MKKSMMLTLAIFAIMSMILAACGGAGGKEAVNLNEATLEEIIAGADRKSVV